MNKYIALIAGGICLWSAGQVKADETLPQENITEDMHKEVVSDPLSQEELCSQPMYPDGVRVALDPERQESEKARGTKAVTYAGQTKLRDAHRVVGRKPVRRAAKATVVAASAEHGVFPNPPAQQQAGEAVGASSAAGRGVKRAAASPLEKENSTASKGNSKPRLQRTVSVHFDLGKELWGAEASSNGPDHKSNVVDE